jgi:molybdopterin converting factor small subunit
MNAGASAPAATVRVRLPVHLRTLAGAPAEVSLEVCGPLTQRCVLDALEARYPALGGTVRDRATGRRRAFIRFFAVESDLSHEGPDDPLPGAVAEGREPFVIIGAMAGG